MGEIKQGDSGLKQTVTKQGISSLYDKERISNQNNSIPENRVSDEVGGKKIRDQHSKDHTPSFGSIPLSISSIRCNLRDLNFLIDVCFDY